MYMEKLEHWKWLERKLKSHMTNMDSWRDWILGSVIDDQDRER